MDSIKSKSDMPRPGRSGVSGLVFLMILMIQYERKELHVMSHHRYTVILDTGGR